jgi:membrane fusion protein, multidrug efflux system
MEISDLRRKVSGKASCSTIGCVLLCALLGMGLACNRGDAKAERQALAATTRAMPVAVANVERKDVPVYLNGLGSVTAFNTVSIRSRVDGQLVQVNFREGQQVKQGELLAVVDPRPFEVQLSQAQAQLFKDQAQLRDAKLNFERFKSLRDAGAVSQQQVDTQQATVDQLEGATRSDQSAIDNAKLQITYCHITAPVAGRIGLRLVDIGNMVHASDQNPMLVITQLRPIAVIFTLPEDNLLAVERRLRQGSPEVEVFSRDGQTKLATGKLLTIDNQIDATTGTGRLKAVFDNKNDELWPNQFVNAKLLLETRKGSTVIPSAAIQRGPQGTLVYVMKPDKTVEVRPVTIALTQSTQSIIDSGLTPGEVVVTDGQDKLQSGSKVEPRSGAGGGGRGTGAPAPGNSNAPGGGAPGSNAPSNKGARGAGNPAS